MVFFIIIILMQHTKTNYSTVFYSYHVLRQRELKEKKRNSLQYNFINYSKIIIKKGSKQGNKTNNYLNYFQLIAATICSNLKKKAMSAEVPSHKQLLNSTNGP